MLNYLPALFATCLALAVIFALITVMLINKCRVFQGKALALPSVADLLDYATLVDNEVIALKSGGLMTTLELKLPNMSIFTDKQVAHVYELSQKALLKLIGNYAVQVDVIRQEEQGYAPFLENTNEVLHDLECKRAALFKEQGSLVSHLYLTITYMGISKESRLLEKLVVRNSEDTELEDETLKLISDFKAAVKAVSTSLETCFEVHHLGSKTILQSHNNLLSYGKADSESNFANASSNAETNDAANNAHHANKKDHEAVSSLANTAIKSSSACDVQCPTTISLDSKADIDCDQKNDESEHHDVVSSWQGDALSAMAALKFNAAQDHALSFHEGLSFIHQCLSGMSNKIATPMSRAYLDSILSDCDLITGHTPKVGTNYVCVIALEGLPPRSHEGLLNTLALLPFAYRFNTRFIYFDQLKSSLLLSKYRRFWAQRSKGILTQVFNVADGRVNQNALDQIAQIDKAKRALDNNEVVFGSYTATVILHDRSFERLQSKAKYVIQAIESTCLSARVETVNATDAFLGSLPGHVFENVRRPIVSQDVLLDLIPLSLPPSGEATSPNLKYGVGASPLMQVRSSGNGLYLMNLHDQDLGNSLVVGPPGSGKSVLLGELMVNLLRYRGMRVFAFDKGCSFYALTKALEGNHVTLENSSRMLCPLQDLETQEDLDYALEFLLMLLRLNGYQCSALDKEELMHCLKLLAAENQSERTLSNFHIKLNNLKLKQVLSPYTCEHNGQNILDGNTNPDTSSLLTTFECAEIFKLPAHFAMPVLKQIFHLIAKEFNGKPAAIVLDEAWLMLKDPVFGNEVIEWFKTLRKYNVIVILATQSLMDLQSSEHFLNILECAKTRIFLPNFDATSEALKDSYRIMGLSDYEIQLVASAVDKKDYYLVKNDQRILFNLMLSKEELTLLSIAGEYQKAAVDKLFNEYGHKFYQHLVNDNKAQALYQRALESSASQVETTKANAPDSMQSPAA